ncbi:hypothetical protein BHM03_00010845 [Ensete ventricosum]|nr:hypothetical protein BHM03_00010845 [Ensete ventricosum]
MLLKVMIKLVGLLLYLTKPATAACEAKSCGRVTNISHPFWLRDPQQPPSGFRHTSFELSCEDGLPILVSSYNSSYYLYDIFYGNKSFWVRNKNFDDEGCAIPYYDMREDSPFSSELARTSHVNVVTLLGFCQEGQRRALVYEYMPNGSLETYIYSDPPETSLPWDKLYQIAIGIARALQYLHHGCNTRIVHFDIKPHNILLDEDFCPFLLGTQHQILMLLLNPKIADFGLAKLCPRKESILSMAEARGTIGYMAPEVFSRSFGAVSTKSDVYSYGMMVLEMVGGRKNIKACADDGTSAVYFPHWIYQYLDGGEDDLRAGDVTAETEEIPRKMMLVGLCIQTAPPNRPCMSRVAEMLERSVGDIQIPPKRYEN